MALTDEQAIKHGIAADPLDDLAWEALADWLSDVGRENDSQFLRLTRRRSRLWCEIVGFQSAAEKTLVAEANAIGQQLKNLFADGAKLEVVTRHEPNTGVRYVWVDAGPTYVISKDTPLGEPSPLDDYTFERYFNLTNDRRRSESLARDFVEGFFISDTPITRGEYSRRAVQSDLPVTRITVPQMEFFLADMNRDDPDFTYSLPTSVQWQYACCDGPLYSYDPYRQGAPYHLDQPQDVAINRVTQKIGPSKKMIHAGTPHGVFPVRMHGCNALGIYDMHFGVFEVVTVPPEQLAFVAERFLPADSLSQGYLRATLPRAVCHGGGYSPVYAHSWEGDLFGDPFYTTRLLAVPDAAIGFRAVAVPRQKE